MCLVPTHYVFTTLTGEGLAIIHRLSNNDMAYRTRPGDERIPVSVKKSFDVVDL